MPSVPRVDLLQSAPDAQRRRRRRRVRRRLQRSALLRDRNDHHSARRQRLQRYGTCSGWLVCAVFTPTRPAQDCIGVSVYRSLSAFKTYEINGI